MIKCLKIAFKNDHAKYLEQENLKEREQGTYESSNAFKIK